MSEVTILIAFFAGLASFLSPCILPLIPGFMAYLSSTNEEGKITRKSGLINSLFFVLGFTLIFAILGILLNNFLDKSSYTIQLWLSRLGGIIIIIFALHILGILKLNFLLKEHKFEVKKYNYKYLSSFVFGSAFAIGWSPCVGAILGSIFALAISAPELAFLMLLAYAFGLGIPFIIVGFFTEESMRLIKRSYKFLKYFNIVVGLLLLILGLLVLTGYLNRISGFLFFFSL